LLLCDPGCFLAAGGGINPTAKALGVGNGLLAKVRVETRVLV
jgi:hypothetical protein